MEGSGKYEGQDGEGKNVIPFPRAMTPEERTAEAEQIASAESLARRVAGENTRWDAVALPGAERALKKISEIEDANFAELVAESIRYIKYVDPHFFETHRFIADAGIEVHQIGATLESRNPGKAIRAARIFKLLMEGLPYWIHTNDRAQIEYATGVLGRLLNGTYQW